MIRKKCVNRLQSCDTIPDLCIYSHNVFLFPFLSEFLSRCCFYIYTFAKMLLDPRTSQIIEVIKLYTQVVGLFAITLMLDVSCL